MNHRQADKRYLEYREGLLSEEEAAAVKAHLHECSSCRESYSTQDAILNHCDIFAEEEKIAPSTLVVQTMEKIAEDQRLSSWFLPYCWQHHFAFGTLAIILLVIVASAYQPDTFTLHAIHGPTHSMNSGLGGGGGSAGGGSAGSFSEAAFDDSLVRTSVGNLFCLIEGALGAFFLVGSALGSAVLFLGYWWTGRKRFRTFAIMFLLLAVGIFGIRSFVSLFFGNDF